MIGPANAIIGEDYGMDLPQVQVQDRDLTEEKKAAKFSRTQEFARLRDHMEARVTYYQHFLPSGKGVLEATDATKLGQQWQVANAVIAELRAIIGFYEQAREIVNERN